MIDSSEGSIMSDLEGMESRRLDTATKIAVEFEDRCARPNFIYIYIYIYICKYIYVPT